MVRSLWSRVMGKRVAKTEERLPPRSLIEAKRAASLSIAESLTTLEKLESEIRRGIAANARGFAAVFERLSESSARSEAEMVRITRSVDRQWEACLALDASVGSIIDMAERLVASGKELGVDLALGKEFEEFVGIAQACVIRLQALRASIKSTQRHVEQRMTELRLPIVRHVERTLEERCDELLGVERGPDWRSGASE